MNSSGRSMSHAPFECAAERPPCPCFSFLRSQRERKDHNRKDSGKGPELSCRQSGRALQQLPGMHRDCGGKLHGRPEIDAASNRGIDEIRELKEKARYNPARDKHKVFIIDEVHMLTTEAFNALLKTLEEPPPHVVFILATTEYHKIPATILSRCQQYTFKLIKYPLIMARLREIAQEEGIRISAAALDQVVFSSGGSMRDAMSARPGDRFQWCRGA